MIFRAFRFVFRGFLLLATLLVVGCVGFWVAAQFRETDMRDLVVPDVGRLVDVAGVQVYVEEAGEAAAPPVLFVHGSVGWSGLWRDQLSDTSQDGFRAIAFDLAPMGFSDRDPVGGYGRVRQADRITALTRAMDIRPILVAHSFGAGPALEAVLRAPERYAGLVIVCGAIGLESHVAGGTLPAILRPILVREIGIASTMGNPWALAPLVRMFLHRKDSLTDAQVDILRQPLRLEGTTAFLSAWLPTLLVPPKDAQSTRSAEIAGAKVPIAFVWGAEDTVTPLDQGQALADLLPDAPLIVLEDVGHIPQIENPAGFSAALSQALRSVRQRAEGG